MTKRAIFFFMSMVAVLHFAHAQSRERYNEISIRWAKTLFMEKPLFHVANALPLGIHYTRHLKNGQGFQVEIGGEFQDLQENQQYYVDQGQNTVIPWLRGFADGSFKWMYPIVKKKPFRLHALGGLTYRKMAEAYGSPGADLLMPLYSDLIGPQLGLKATLNVGRFIALGLSQEAGTFYLIGRNMFPPGQTQGVYLTSRINFTTRFSLGICF